MNKEVKALTQSPHCKYVHPVTSERCPPSIPFIFSRSPGTSVRIPLWVIIMRALPVATLNSVIVTFNRKVTE